MYIHTHTQSLPRIFFGSPQQGKRLWFAVIDILPVTAGFHKIEENVLAMLQKLKESVCVSPSLIMMDSDSMEMLDKARPDPKRSSKQENVLWLPVHQDFSIYVVHLLLVILCVVMLCMSCFIFFDRNSSQSRTSSGRSQRRCCGPQFQATSRSAKGNSKWCMEHTSFSRVKRRTRASGSSSTPT